MIASSVPDAETLAFICRHLPSAPARVLDIGCGQGALAIALQRLGYEIVAIDNSARRVAEAKLRGVNAHQAEWPHLTAAPFEAIIFAHSLHHVRQLDNSIVQAQQLLEAGGRVLVDDFAWEQIDGIFAEWIYQLAILLQTSVEWLGPNFQVADNALDAWHQAHDSVSNSSQEIEQCLRRYFHVVAVEDVPYLYRYLFASGPAGSHDEICRLVMKFERRLADVRGMPMIGRRFVCESPRNGPQYVVLQ